MSDDARANALKAAITAALAGAGTAYDLDEIPSPAPPNYVEFYLARRFGGNQREGGPRDTNLRRMSTRVVASTVTNGRLLEGRIADRFASAPVALDGQPVWVSYETGGGDFNKDEGWYTALTDWTFSL